MSQAEVLGLMLGATLAAEWPLVAERAIITVTRQSEIFEISPLGSRVEIRFGRQAFCTPDLMQIIHDAGAAAEQALMGCATKPRHASRLVELHESGAPFTHGIAGLSKVMVGQKRSYLQHAKDWLWDREGIRASLRAASGHWELRVPTEDARLAQVSLHLFRQDWKRAEL